jgi:hypothetical protein
MKCCTNFKVQPLHPIILKNLQITVCKITLNMIQKLTVNVTTDDNNEKMKILIVYLGDWV